MLNISMGNFLKRHSGPYEGSEQTNIGNFIVQKDTLNGKLQKIVFYKKQSPSCEIGTYDASEVMLWQSYYFCVEEYKIEIKSILNDMGLIIIKERLW